MHIADCSCLAAVSFVFDFSLLFPFFFSLFSSLLFCFCCYFFFLYNIQRFRHFRPTNASRSSDIRYARDGLVLFNEQIGLTPTRLNLQAKSFRLQVCLWAELCSPCPSEVDRHDRKLPQSISFCCTFVFIRSFVSLFFVSFTLVYVRWLTFCLVFCLRKNFELVCACSAESFTKLSPLDTDHERFTKSIISLLLALFAPLEWSCRVLHKRRTRSLIVQFAKLVA